MNGKIHIQELDKIAIFVTLLFSFTYSDQKDGVQKEYKSESTSKQTT